MNVLLVDDEPGIVHLVSAVLGLLGHRVQVLIHPEDVVEALSRQQTDLLISDVHMPGMSGFELIEKISQENTLKVPPVFFITGNQSSVDQIRSNAPEGVLGVLSKPFSIDELKQAISKAEDALREAS